MLTFQEKMDAIESEIASSNITTPEKLLRAKIASQQDGIEPTTYHLVKMGILTPEQIVPVLSKYFDCPGIDLMTTRTSKEALEKIDADMAIRYRSLPIKITGDKLTIALADPSDIEARDELRFRSDLELEVLVADPYTINEKIKQLYHSKVDDRIHEAMTELKAYDDVTVVQDDPEESLAELQQQIDAAPMVKLVSGLLHEAVRRKASDIHIEPYDDRVRIRYRVDGVLVETYEFPKQYKNALISRIKILANLDIGEKRLSQDGRIKLRVGGRAIDFRISTMPVASGSEKVVLRILDKSNVNLDLENLGIGERGYGIIEQTLASPYGCIIATGPTGSGKTTTLYSMILKLNTGAENIISVEDPVEYHLEGINQVDVNIHPEMSFASALRAFLRQDPNIIMVGEMRDRETAEIAIQAAMTGHLVLSTLHTNDAASAFTRLMNMKVEPHNIASSISTVIAQRLVRALCQRCKRPATINEAYLRIAGVPEEEWDSHSFMEGEGCDACDGIGYAGRLGLYEVLPVTPSIQELILKEASAGQIREHAKAEGLITLRDIGMHYAREGRTSLREVITNTIQQ